MISDKYVTFKTHNMLWWLKNIIDDSTEQKLYSLRQLLFPSLVQLQWSEEFSWVKKIR